MTEGTLNLFFGMQYLPGASALVLAGVYLTSLSVRQCTLPYSFFLNITCFLYISRTSENIEVIVNVIWCSF